MKTDGSEVKTVKREREREREQKESKCLQMRCERGALSARPTVDQR